MSEALQIPQHIAIILDGNGRWATAQGKPRSYGHVVGCDNLEHMCEVIGDLGVRYLTVYAFSTENWKRSAEEVGVLMNLFRRYLKRLLKTAHKRQMRVKIIGDPKGLAPDIQKSIRELEGETEHYTAMVFQIALNYGGRDEIVRAVARLTADVRRGLISEQDCTEDRFSTYLDTAGVPDPDLLIRTSGEQRLSNFLPWQLAYTELVFVDTPWPAFGEKELQDALTVYAKRDRRYGGV